METDQKERNRGGVGGTRGGEDCQRPLPTHRIIRVRKGKILLKALGAWLGEKGRKKKRGGGGGENGIFAVYTRTISQVAI